MKPLANYVLLGEVKAELKTDSGIILTKSVSTGNIPGKVLAVGPEVNSSIEVGSEVICDWKSSTPVMVEGAQCVLIKDEHILAVV